jgi:hypothetical protein
MCAGQHSWRNFTLGTLDFEAYSTSIEKEYRRSQFQSLFGLKTFKDLKTRPCVNPFWRVSDRVMREVLASAAAPSLSRRASHKPTEFGGANQRVNVDDDSVNTDDFRNGDSPCCGDGCGDTLKQLKDTGSIPIEGASWNDILAPGSNPIPGNFSLRFDPPCLQYSHDII